MPTESQAVRHLTELGLTEYEARCYVALSRVSTASAAEVADLSEVPRSRVYDALDRLHGSGLVDVQQSEPRRYRALSTDAALETFRERHESTLEAADDALSQLQRTESLEEEGAWAIENHDRVTDRIEAFLGDAEDEVYALVADVDTLDRRLYEQLATVSGSDLDTFVEVPTEEIRDRVQAEVPAASVEETALADVPATIEGKRMGRIVMVDRRSVLFSAVTDDARGGRTETAIWASGPDHGLVVGARHVFGSRIDATFDPE